MCNTQWKRFFSCVNAVLNALRPNARSVDCPNSTPNGWWSGGSDVDQPATASLLGRGQHIRWLTLRAIRQENKSNQNPLAIIHHRSMLNISDVEDRWGCPLECFNMRSARRSAMRLRVLTDAALFKAPSQSLKTPNPKPMDPKHAAKMRQMRMFQGGMGVLLFEKCCCSHF